MTVDLIKHNYHCSKCGNPVGMFACTAGTQCGDCIGPDDREYYLKNINWCTYNEVIADKLDIDELNRMMAL